MQSCQGDCPCLSRYGPSYDENHKLTKAKVDPYRNHQKPIYECNATCKCSRECHNRVVQGGVSVKLEVFRTSQKGFGLRALEDISKYSFVCEYAGEVLTYEDAKKRTKVLNEAESANYYILAVKEHLGTGEVLTTYVDPMYVGNVGRFINHSCDPNLFMIPVRINNDVPRMGLFALRDVAAGEELTFEYSGVIQSSPDDEEGAQGNKGGTPVITFRKRVCHCGANNCRGYLPFDDNLYSE